MCRRISLIMTLLLHFPLAHAAGVHQHGVAQLDMVVEPPLVAIGLSSPLANLIGFEHRPANAAEQQAWHQLQSDLRQASQLFTLPTAADCSLSQVNLHLPFAGTPAASHEHHHDEHSNQQDAHAHTDLMAEYQFLCANTDALRHLGLPLLQRFPAIEQLQIQLIIPSGQHSRTLHAGETRLSLP